jgi:hypothetical protein
MGYYQGDFYGRPGMYRGDPGFFSFLGGLAKKAVGFIPGVGPIASGAIEAVSGGLAKRAGGAMKSVGGAIVRHPVLSAAGAAGAIGIGAGVTGSRMLGGHRKCKHINPRTGKCVRRMRVTNPRALRRAIRRAHGFARLAMKTIHLVHPKKKVRFGGFKKKTKK